MKHEDLGGCLRQLTPTEQFLKEYYLSHHKLMDFHLLLKIMENQTETFTPDQGNPLSSILAEYAVMNNDSYYLMDHSLDVMHIRNEPLQKFESLIIQKQTRYAPIIFTDINGVCISYAYSGSGAFILRGKNGRTTEIGLEQGDLLLLPPSGGSHKIESDDCIILAFALSTGLMRELTVSAFPEGFVRNFYVRLLEEDSSADALLIHTGEDEFIQNVIDQFIRECISPGTSIEEAVTFRKLTMAALLTYVQKTYGSEAPVLQNGRYRQSVLSMYKYIEDHYADFSLDEMALHFGYSRAYMSRYYKENTGVNIRTVLNGIRMKRAEILLEKTDLPVEAVAAETGYLDTPFFIETFKKAHHITPLQYRKKQQAG